MPTGDALVAIAAPDTARGSLATSDRCFSPSYDESQLGLSLCRDIVVAHGGRPWVDRLIPTGRAVPASGLRCPFGLDGGVRAK